MNEAIKSLDIEKVKLTAAKMRNICLMFDAQILVLELDKLMAQIEAKTRNYPFNIRITEKGKQLQQRQKQHLE